MNRARTRVALSVLIVVVSGCAGDAASSPPTSAEPDPAAVESTAPSESADSALIALLPAEFAGEALETRVFDAETTEGIGGPVAAALDVPLTGVTGVSVGHPDLFGMEAWRFPGADSEAVLEEFIDAHVVPPGSDEPARTDERIGDMDVSHFAPSGELGTPDQYVFVIDDDVVVRIMTEDPDAAEEFISTFP